MFNRYRKKFDQNLRKFVEFLSQVRSQKYIVFFEEIQDIVFSFSFLIFDLFFCCCVALVGKLFCRLPEAISSSPFSGWLSIAKKLYLKI